MELTVKPGTQGGREDALNARVRPAGVNWSHSRRTLSLKDVFLQMLFHQLKYQRSQGECLGSLSNSPSPTSSFPLMPRQETRFAGSVSLPCLACLFLNPNTTKSPFLLSRFGFTHLLHRSLRSLSLGQLLSPQGHRSWHPGSCLLCLGGGPSCQWPRRLHPWVSPTCFWLHSLRKAPLPLCHPRSWAPFPVLWQISAAYIHRCRS